MSEESKIVIGVPGKWADNSDIVRSIVSDSDGYMFAGNLMMHIESKESCTLEVYEHDSDLVRAFTLAGCGNISESDLALIGDHSNTLYVSLSSNSQESAQKIMRFAAALLSCGGIAVKVESTGIAHSADRWRSLMDEDSLLSRMRAFVTYVGNKGSFYSCGMHAIGLPDATLTADVMPDTAATLLDTFLLYTASESPSIEDGETFAIDEHSPRYVIKKGDCTEFPKDNLFHNPNGMWNLTAVEKPKRRRR